MSTAVLYYCTSQGTVRVKMFYFVCEKYDKPITVQYYIADCVSWVCRLTLLDLRINWTYKCTLGMELVCG